MQTISDRPVYFGEFAGPLVQGAVFFDWQLISTQELAAAFGYSFEEILDKNGIPYAPVGVDATIHRYPTIGERITVNTHPLQVGESSLTLRYIVSDNDNEPLASIDATHVTIDANGGASPIPESTREAFAEAISDPGHKPDPPTVTADPEPTHSFEWMTPVRSPYIEGAELAYFEEYPRFADIALENYVSKQGQSVGELSGEKYPYRIRNWHWDFRAPVRFESELHIDCGVIACENDLIRVAHEFSTGETTNITGITEYGCFDETGAPTSFDNAMLKPFR